MMMITLQGIIKKVALSQFPEYTSFRFDCRQLEARRRIGRRNTGSEGRYRHGESALGQAILLKLPK